MDGSMTQEEQVAAYRSRMERVTQMLRARTDADGNALPGFKQNVAAIRAELAQLQENIDKAGDRTHG
jgi:hypothetical protein